jgi:outer membrane murein-binding lipoprotein Lpp
MSDVVMLEAALFQLRSGAEGLADLDVFLAVLANAIDGAREGGVNAARVNDIEFALHDLAAAVDELPATDANRLAPALAMMREDVERLRQETALPREVIDRIRALQAKLRTRAAAIERQTYREGGDAAPLPHPPEELRADALPLRAELAAAGFATPSLDALIDDPSSVRFHSLGELVDELDVVAG